MMHYLIIDTESTGLPIADKNPFHYPEYWPRLVQLAWILADDAGTVLDEDNVLIRPEGFEIPKSAVKVHGITTEMAAAIGQPLSDVLNRFSGQVETADVIVGHNILYDRNVVTAEYARASQNAPIYGLRYHCTMRSTTDICKIPSPRRGGGYKWPTLNELHLYLFNESAGFVHDASADARTCAKCYFELKKQGYFNDLITKPV